MKTKEEITKEFMEDLKALLNKYNATLSSDDHYQGYPECGQDLRMTVEIPSQWDGDKLIIEWTEINLGKEIGL